MVEDKVASEEQIRYVLANVTDLRIRASYPVKRHLCAEAGPLGSSELSRLLGELCFELYG
jgi:hypothetical protein